MTGMDLARAMNATIDARGPAYVLDILRGLAVMRADNAPTKGFAKPWDMLAKKLERVIRDLPPPVEDGSTC